MGSLRWHLLVTLPFCRPRFPASTIPDEMLRQMQEAGENSAAMGNKLATELALKLKRVAQGVYLMPAFGRYDRAAGHRSHPRCQIKIFKK